MQWYVSLITVSATAVLGWVAFEWLGRPIRMLYGLRREVHKQMLALGNISLPKPRELAITSREIGEYDQAVRNVREAQRTLRDLGSQLLAFGENEPAACNALATIGLRPVAAGSRLIELSVAYSRPSVDRMDICGQIERALRLTGAAPAAAQPSGAVSLVINAAHGGSLQYVNHRT
jgi:HAMP domain-containing protein